MGVISTSQIFGLTIRESADDGSDFTDPAADYRRLFLGEDGQLHVKDSAGAVTAIGSGSGGMATDALADAVGDMFVGTGANTIGRVAIGAAGRLWKSDGTTASWALPTMSGCSIKETTAQTITNTTPAALTSNEENWDTDGWHESVTNPTRITNPFGVTIYVRASAALFFAANATGYRALSFRVNGSVVEKGITRAGNAGASVGTYVSGSGDFILTSGQYLEVWADQASGGNLNVNMSDFTVTLIGV